MKEFWASTAENWRPEIRWLLCAACLAIIMGSWLAVCIVLSLDYDNTVTEMHRENINLAKVCEEHIRRVIGGVEDSLLLLKNEYERKGRLPSVTDHVFYRSSSIQFVNYMVICDPEGTVIAGTNHLAAEQNIADREYFKTHRGGAPERLYIGKPVIDKITDQAMIPISHRINKQDGSFGGVVAALISINYFDDYYRKMELADNKIVVVTGINGITELRIKGERVKPRVDRQKDKLFWQITQQTEDSFMAEYEADEQRRFFSFRVIPEYHLLINVGTLFDQRLAAYYQRRRWYWAAACCFNLIVAWGGRLLDKKISLLLHTQQQLAISEVRYRAIFEAANDGIFVHDAKSGVILDINKKACDSYGYTKEELLSSNLAALGTGESPYTTQEAHQWLRLAADGEPQLFEWRNRHKQGHAVWVEVNLKYMTIGTEERILAVVRDISERKSQQEQIRRIAYYDSLTGLPNRSFLKEILEQEQKKAGRGEAVGAIMFVDLDDLKMVNDSFGHSCGDTVITIAGRYISAAIGKDSMVARIGGDEFIIMLPNQSDREKITLITDRLIKQLGRNYEIGETTIYMSASIGVALYPMDGNSAEDLLKKADLAMYVAKESGKNTWRFYNSSMEKGNREKMSLKFELRGAIERGELSLQYQPIMPISREGSISFEALLRWTSREYGIVSPARFIPLAEENETICKIGQWVLEQAVGFVQRLAEAGECDVRVSVNVSPRQLVADNFVALVRSTIDNAGIKPHQLGIEITENALIASLSDSTHKLIELRNIGVHLSMDDFGTGYSSLTYLRNLPVQTIKIDKSFIDEIVSDEAQVRFIQGIFDLAHIRGLTVVAEGVESKAQLDILVMCNCDFIQGYVFSHPISAQEAIRFLAMNKSVKSM